MNRVIIIIAFFLICYVPVLGQTAVTGHVSAEIVESVSIENGFQEYITTSDPALSVELGSLKLPSNEQYAYHLSVKDATIYNNESAYALTMNYSINETTKDNTSDISLSVRSDTKVLKGDYDGNVTVVVSFN